MADKSGRTYFDVQKSENDPRYYRLIELQNRLKILLISDKDADKAAASADVHIGHYVDPDEVPGIAHFCEHMMFLGTDKYPVENDFSEFISKNGGRMNAYTSTEHTNYHFEIKCSALDGALDRFSNFFLSPRFDEDSTDRELNAIDSEHQKNILHDVRRWDYIDRITSKNGHVYQKFGTGNLETLKTIPVQNGIDIRKLLLDFHQKYYSANIMTVAVLGVENLDTLEEMVVSKFQNVTDKNVVVPKYDEHCYGPEQVGVTLNIQTVKQLKTLHLKFPMADHRDMYKEQPNHYVSHLLGHEGEGSLLALLKKKSLVHSLCSGAYDGGTGFSFFSINMELSEEGLKNINDIIEFTFQYIKLLKSEEPSETIFKELQMLSEMRFRFQDKVEPLWHVMRCSKSMHDFAPEDVLNGHHVMCNFRPDVIKEILQCLRPDNFRCLVLTDEKNDELEYASTKYYDARYNITRIPEETINKWDSIGLNEHLHLPHKNPFIPNSLKVKADKIEKEVKAVPELIKDTNMVRVWYKQDDTFYLPKASLKIHICSPMSRLTPAHAVHRRLFLSLLEDELNEYDYDANLAGLQDYFGGTTLGLLLSISGYDDKQLVFLEKILRKMVALPLKQDRFQLQVERLEQELNNFDKSQPYQQISELKRYLIQESFWKNSDLLESLKDVSLSTLKGYVASYFKRIYIEMLFCGNLTHDDASKTVNTIETILIEENKAKPILPVQHSLLREYQLPEGCSYLYEKCSTVHTMSCVQVYLQVGLQKSRENVLCELYTMMMKEPAFHTLRTTEQLGYLTSSGLSRTSSVQGVSIMIQSDKSPALVEQRIDHFLKSYEETLDSMTDETFSDFVEALIVKKLEKPKRINIETRNHWIEISSKEYHFRRGEYEVEELKKLKKGDVISFYKKYISPEAKERKKVVFILLGKDAESLVNEAELSKWTVIDDVTTFKTSLPLYPLMLPFNNLPLIANTKARL